jgi:prolipoprotein diacylglyceryltransferase
VPPHWWGPFAIWTGGLGIWGGIAAGVLVGLWYARRRGRTHAQILRLMDCVAPALLVEQAIGRIGNYFNQELFGKASTLPWALKIDPAHRPPHYTQFATFQPTFLYKLIWNLLLAGFLAWLVRRRMFRAPGVFALYVAGYSGFRIFEESVRIDYSQYILWMRLNFWIATIISFAALLWLWPFSAIPRPPDVRLHHRWPETRTAPTSPAAVVAHQRRYGSLSLDPTGAVRCSFRHQARTLNMPDMQRRQPSRAALARR